MTRTPSTAVARRRLRSTPEDLFRALLDPDLLATVARVTGVTVLRPGRDGPQGVGTLRRVDLPGGAYLVEEILGLEPPYAFDYLLRESSVPMEHRYGRIEFRRSGEATEALWISEFTLPGRWGRLAQPVAAVGTRAAFGQALRGLDRVASRTAARS